MECVIHYTGSLKKDTDIDFIYEKIKTQLETIPCSINVVNGEMSIEFDTKKSNPLKFRFDKRKMDEKFQWDTYNKDILYAIFDLFTALKPYFRSLDIDDTDDQFNHYLLSKKECKVHYTKAESKSELELIKRAAKYKYNKLSDEEKNLLSEFGENIFSDRVFVLVMQDLFQLCDAPGFEKKVKKKVSEIIRQIPQYMDFMYAPSKVEFLYNMVFLWLNYSMSYNGLGMVHQLSGKEKGLASSLAAAVFALSSSYFGIYSAIANEKHRQINIFFNQQYTIFEQWDLSTNNNGSKEITILLSLLNYLGFSYKGMSS